MNDTGDDPSRDMSPAAVLARAVAARGDIYPEWAYAIDAWPEMFELMQQTAGHFHKYSGDDAPGERLSGEMRELIATPALCSKTSIRHAANHVRKMYRMGLTNRVVLEAGIAFATVSGVSTVANLVYAIMEAHNPHFAFGKMPEGGAPKVLKRFPELDLGRARTGTTCESHTDAPEWRYAAGIDAEFARVATRWMDFSLLAGETDLSDALLGPGIRELVAVAALAARGEEGLAAGHIRRAYDWGMTRAQVLDAIMSVLPMTGLVTAQIGLRAMQAADQG